MVRIEQVVTKKQQKIFNNFPLELYKDCEFYIPNLYIDESSMFKKSGTYSDVTECVYFLAYRDEKVVGRIQGINQLSYNKAHNSRQIRFARFDSIDDQEVANALFDAVFAWAKSINMDNVVGPLGFSDFEREGLLVEGFDQPQTFEEQYNYDYYEKLIINYGFEKDVEWIEFQLRKRNDLDPKFFNVTDRILKMNHLTLIDTDKVRKGKYINTYKEQFFRLVEDCYKELYGVCPFTEKSKKALVAEIRYLLNKKYFRVIVDENNHAVAFGLLLPSIAEPVRLSKGHITPRFIVNVLKAMKNPKVIDLLLIAIEPEYQKRGITAVLLKLLNDMFTQGVEYYETNLNLVDNKEIIGCWKYFDAKQNKRRRCYKKLVN